MRRYLVGNSMRRFRPAILAVLLLAGVTAQGETAGFKGTLRTEVASMPAMDVPFWVDDKRLRMDVTEPMKMTVIWSFGADRAMRMIRHDTQEYVEWGPVELRNARQMVRQAQGLRSATSQNNPVLHFEPTGRQAEIGQWEAIEMRPAGNPAADANSGRLWTTADADHGLVEFFTHYARALQETTMFPMYGTENDPLGLNAATRFPLDRLGTATGLDRPVVRIVTSSVQGGSTRTTIVTLQSVEPGPFADDVFAVPAGYKRKASLSSGVQ